VKVTTPVIGEGSTGDGIISFAPRSMAAVRAASALPSKSMSLLATTVISPEGSAKRALQKARA
jgi:hypothetical protein